MESNGGSARRPSLVAAVDAARAGDAEAADTVVVLCRPELLRLARSIDAATAEPVVDELLDSFVGWLDRLHFDDTPEVWFYLYQSCRQLMGGGALAAPPERVAPPEPAAQAEAAALPTELTEAPGAELQPRRLGVAEWLGDAVSARRSLITASLLIVVLCVSAAMAANRWETMNVLDDVNLVSVDGEGVAEPLTPGEVDGDGVPLSPLGPGTSSDDSGRAIFTRSSSDPAPPASTTSSAVVPETTTTTIGSTTTTITDPSTTTTLRPTTSSNATVVLPPVVLGDEVVTSTTSSPVVVLPGVTLLGSSTLLPPVVLDDQVSPTTTP